MQNDSFSHTLVYTGMEAGTHARDVIDRYHAAFDVQQHGDKHEHGRGAGQLLDSARNTSDYDSACHSDHNDYVAESTGVQLSATAFEAGHRKGGSARLVIIEPCSS
jgi:hypothetical protein